MRMQAAEALIVERRAKWTRAKFDRLVELGAFVDERVELVRGELVEMSPIGVPHGNQLEWLNEWLMPRLVGRARVRVQLPLALDSESELQPDLAVLERRTPRAGHPTTALLVIEVADSTVRYDRLVKGPLYAEAGVVEYWVVHAEKAFVEVFSAPRHGRYTRQTRHSKGALPVPGFPDVEVPLAELFA
jgi:Uma2 family endonuclease